MGLALNALFHWWWAEDFRDARWLFVPYVIRGVGDVLLAVLSLPPLVWWDSPCLANMTSDGAEKSQRSGK